MRSSTVLSTLAVSASAALAQESVATATVTSVTNTVVTASSSASSSAAAGSSGASSVTRPSDVPPCDFYANITFGASNATTQYTLLTALVNTAVIGNYSSPPPAEAVTGILNNGTTSSGVQVSLLKYFDGMLASTNRGGESGVAVNFLDDGGAAPLMKNMPANGTDSNQYFLLTHLYQYFGGLLGCSAYGTQGFSAYKGDNSQYDVHKFMDLDHDEITYFIEQVGAAAKSFGVLTSDIEFVANALDTTFNYRCLPKTAVQPNSTAELQSICIAESCPEAKTNSTCSAYMASKEPVAANSTNKDNSKPAGGDNATKASGSGEPATSTDAQGNVVSQSASGAAVANGVAAGVFGVAGFFALAFGL